MPTLKAIWYEHLSDMWVSILRSVHNTRWQVAALSPGHISLRVYRSGDKLKQQVEATDHSVCTGRATSCSNKSRRLITPCSWVTSCSNKSRRLITPCVQVGRLVAATSRGDWSLRAVERQVAATSRGHWSLCVQVGRQVATTSRGHWSLRVYRSGD